MHIVELLVRYPRMYPIVLAWYFWKTVKISKPSTCFETIILCLFLNTFFPQYHSFKACTWFSNFHCFQKYHANASGYVDT